MYGETCCNRFSVKQGFRAAKKYGLVWFLVRTPWIMLWHVRLTHRWTSILLTWRGWSLVPSGSDFVSKTKSNSLTKLRKRVPHLNGCLSINWRTGRPPVKCWEQRKLAFSSPSNRCAISCKFTKFTKLKDFSLALSDTLKAVQEPQVLSPTLIWSTSLIDFRIPGLISSRCNLFFHVLSEMTRFWLWVLCSLPTWKL